MNLNIKLNKYRTRLREGGTDSGYDDDSLAPVMPAIDVVQQLIEEEGKSNRRSSHNSSHSNSTDPPAGTSSQSFVSDQSSQKKSSNLVEVRSKFSKISLTNPETIKEPKLPLSKSSHVETHKQHSLTEIQEEEESLVVRDNPFMNIINNTEPPTKQEEYEFIPKSVILDVYSNDPEVKRFLKQLPKIYNEAGYNEQDYKCYSCRRPIGLVFGQSRLCHFDGHHYCSDCHLSEKSVIPARILCNWDFNKYPVSKRNQHFLTLITNEPMFDLKKISSLLYKMCSELRDIEELRRQAFFIRSYCTTCVQESISFELTKLIWPREHLFKQIDLYSLEDLIQIKNGALKQVLKNVISLGRHHVLYCPLCCQKGFICELCKSSQIIYPFDTELVYRCNDCQSIYHKKCFIAKPGVNDCPRCQRLKARRHDI